MSTNVQSMGGNTQVHTNAQDVAALVGRLLLASIFITSGFGKITGFEGTVGYIASKGLPLPQVAAVIAILVELGGGILFAIGYKARWAALALSVFTLAAGFLFHNYWAVDAAQKMGQQINFWKNIAITGGFLMAYAFGPGRYSLDKMTHTLLEKQELRAIERVAQSQIAPVGTFTVRRALPFRERHSVGPWVFLDHFGPFRVKPGEDGVGAHPHAGIETVTYILSGRQQHRDSAGHTGIVAAGGAQWMTAGRGIIHAEHPVPQTEEEHTLHGIQLWTSLPRALKLMAPRYQNLTAESIAEVKSDGVRTRVIAGELAGVTGPAATLMPALLWHVRIDAGAVFEAAIPDGFEAGVYVIDGSGVVGEDQGVGTGELAVLAGTQGALRVRNAGTGTLDMMVLGGTPAEGPLVFHGPFVMNSVDQVRAAEIAYRTGRMGELD